MAENKPQSLANHRRFVPMFHIVLFLILVVNLIWSGWHLYGNLGMAATMNLLVAVALCLLFWYTRIFPLAVQDRLIRLEERLRLTQVLPEDLVFDLGVNERAEERLLAPVQEADRTDRKDPAARGTEVLTQPVPQGRAHNRPLDP